MNLSLSLLVVCLETMNLSQSLLAIFPERSLLHSKAQWIACCLTQHNRAQLAAEEHNLGPLGYGPGPTDRAGEVGRLMRRYQKGDPAVFILTSALRGTNQVMMVTCCCWISTMFTSS
jgi:hypothetical protein